MMVRRATFSSRRATLASRKEDNCCRWESCYSFNSLFNYSRRWCMEGFEAKGRSPIDLVDLLN